MIPRIRFANLPTPIEPMAHLSALLGGPRLWIKRDDLTGLAFGGNKTRKLEFIMAEAQGYGARTLITVGSIQSNHCRQTAAIAARMGMKCILVLSGDPPPVVSGNLLLDHLFGAELVWCSREEREAVLKKIFQNSWEAGDRPMLIPLGASTPIGALGYVYAMEEIFQQNIVQPDWIVVASSSGGTQAGMVLGAKRKQWQGKILGISIDETPGDLQQKVASLALEAAERMNYSLKLSTNEVLVNGDYLGKGYAVMGPGEAEAIHLFARYEGVLLCPVYSGRAAAGMIDLIRKGFFRKDESVLFWHTGGNPALFAEPYSSQLQREYSFAEINQKDSLKD
jgi:D-cysteine desulfhydrase family pyridoxal phosphate-dependent enzyme